MGNATLSPLSRESVVNSKTSFACILRKKSLESARRVTFFFQLSPFPPFFFFAKCTYSPAREKKGREHKIGLIGCFYGAYYYFSHGYYLHYALPALRNRMAPPKKRGKNTENYSQRSLACLCVFLSGNSGDVTQVFFFTYFFTKKASFLAGTFPCPMVLCMIQLAWILRRGGASFGIGQEELFLSLIL